MLLPHSDRVALVFAALLTSAYVYGCAAVADGVLTFFSETPDFVRRAAAAYVSFVVARWVSEFVEGWDWLTLRVTALCGLYQFLAFVAVLPEAVRPCFLAAASWALVPFAWQYAGRRWVPILRALVSFVKTVGFWNCCCMLVVFGYCSDVVAINPDRAVAESATKLAPGVLKLAYDASAHLVGWAVESQTRKRKREDLSAHVAACEARRKDVEDYAREIKVDRILSLPRVGKGYANVIKAKIMNVTCFEPLSDHREDNEMNLDQRCIEFVLVSIWVMLHDLGVFDEAVLEAIMDQMFVLDKFCLALEVTRGGTRLKPETEYLKVCKSKAKAAELSRRYLAYVMTLFQLNAAAQGRAAAVLPWGGDAASYVKGIKKSEAGVWLVDDLGDMLHPEAIINVSPAGIARAKEGKKVVAMALNEDRYLECDAALVRALAFFGVAGASVTLFAGLWGDNAPAFALIAELRRAAVKKSFEEGGKGWLMIQARIMKKPEAQKWLDAMAKAWGENGACRLAMAEGWGEDGACRLAHRRMLEDKTSTWWTSRRARGDKELLGNLPFGSLEALVLHYVADMTPDEFAALEKQPELFAVTVADALEKAGRSRPFSVRNTWVPTAGRSDIVNAARNARKAEGRLQTVQFGCNAFSCERDSFSTKGSKSYFPKHLAECPVCRAAAATIASATTCADCWGPKGSWPTYTQVVRAAANAKKHYDVDFGVAIDLKTFQALRGPASKRPRS
mmetsp:Transcript_3907/g.11537  ORF Transcript_3907/g.11537 Transcript_3907/m.11537 type:complete len:733 (+) Transcript_3907:193-2391(+)